MIGMLYSIMPKAACNVIIQVTEDESFTTLEPSDDRDNLAIILSVTLSLVTTLVGIIIIAVSLLSARYHINNKL